MKRIFALAATILFFTACNAPKADDAATSDKKAVIEVKGTPYDVDTTSVITWTGSKPTGQNTGIFPVQGGTILVDSGQVVGGNFVIDISRLKDNDLAADPKNQATLEGHLKSPDFFDVAKYPLANFVITSVAPYIADSSKEVLLADVTHTITGNLTLKDKTKSISFPARLTVDENSAATQANFNIDRTDWNINYKGPGNPQDWVISKTVNIKLNITAVKK